MPAVSQRQQRFFGGIKGGSIPKPEGMSEKTVDDFARTKRAGLSERAPHLAGGRGAIGFPKQAEWRQIERGIQGTGHATPSSARVPHFADGHWMEKAFKNAGNRGHSLHASLHVPSDEPIPAGKLSGALHSGSPHKRRMAQAAANAGAVRERRVFGA